ncbi:GNAT family N-acetyltransferase [Pirellulales bacterium]|nr:GNAT family N-acetyltransferase [Pirellulales bacterium]
MSFRGATRALDAIRVGTVSMQAVCFQRLEDLNEFQNAWDTLAPDQVFRSWDWVTTWWRHYGLAVGGRSQRREFRVVVAMGHDGPAAILPCYVETCWARGRVWRLCGDGEVCSDHLGLLVGNSGVGEVGVEEAVEVLAKFFAERDDWDLLDFSAIDAADGPTRALGTALRDRGLDVRESPASQVWRIALPESWDEYLATLSKSHRKKLRRLEKNSLESAAIRWRVVESNDDFAEGWQIFRDLHTRRWESLGHSGCFAMPRWSAFHEDIAPRLLGQKRLRLAWLERGGVPLASEYQFVAGQTVSAYQGGVDPDSLDDDPGRLSHICGVKQAIAEGRRDYDFLRGDEAYKQNYRAEPHPVISLQAAPRRLSARWRRQAYAAARQAGRAARRFVGLFG